MGMSGGGAAGWQSRRSRRRAAPVMAEINVTPMVDVMLVLLIIFMVAAPLLAVQQSAEVAQTGSQGPEQENPVYIYMKQGDQIWGGTTPLNPNEIAKYIEQASKNDKNKRVWVISEYEVGISKVMDVTDAVKKAGFKNVTIAREPAR